MLGVMLLRCWYLSRAAARQCAAVSIPGERIERPPFDDRVIPGTFGHNVLSPALELVAAREAHPLPADEECAGNEPPVACREALEAGRGPMRQVLQATRSEAGGMPTGYGLAVTTAQRGFLPLFDTVRLAGLEIDHLLAHRETREAVEICVETVALAREMTLAGYVIGRVWAAHIQHVMQKPCLAALAAASPSERRLARDQLLAIERSIPPFEYTIDTERAWMILGVCGYRLPEEEIEQLSPAARELIVKSIFHATSEGDSSGALPFSSFTEGDYCRALNTYTRGLISAIPLTEAEQMPALEALHESQWFLNTFVHAVDWTPYFERDRRARKNLEALVRAAQ